MYINKCLLIFPITFLVSFSHPQRSNFNHNFLRGFALNPAEINNVYVKNILPKDVPPQPLIRPEATIEETVREVEELIKKDPKLPRLTRGEIFEIIENITKPGNEREQGQRALMVVMPFTAGSAQGNDIKELYTRTPVTRIIGEEEGKKEGGKMRKKPPRKWEMDDENEILKGQQDEEKINEILKNYQKNQEKQNNEGNDLNNAFKNHKPQNDQINVPTFQFLPQIKTTTEAILTTKRKRPFNSAFKQQPFVHLKPTTISTTRKPDTKFTNHKYEDTMSSGIKVMAPPFFLVEEDKGFSHPYVMRIQKPQVTIEEVKLTPDMYGDTPKPKVKEVLKVSSTTPKIPIISTEESKIIKTTKRPNTPLIITTENKLHDNLKQTDEIPVVSSSTKNNRFSTEATAILNEMSIPNHYKDAIEGLDLLITPEEQKIPFQKQALFQIESFQNQKSSTPLPDISNVANNLSPEMKDLLMSFGLINNPTTEKPEETEKKIKEEISNQENPRINSESYVRFKPLPVNSPGRNDMEELLSRFGLGRNQKSIDFDKKTKTNPKNSEFHLEAVPDNLRSVVRDIGIDQKTIQKLKEKEEKNNHIFKPDLQMNATEEELKKLGKLLDMIKTLEHMKGNITKESLKDFDSETLKELIKDLNGNAVIPLNEKDSGLDLKQIEEDLIKKGVKREENTENVDFVTVTPSSTISDEPLTEFSVVSAETMKPSADESKVITTTEEITTTTTPRTGFYYLLDWNSFWEMDNQSGKRINLRFQPHAGNPKFFTSVTVP